MMAWADTHIQRLMRGETIQFRPVGNSMKGLIRSGQLCTVVPVVTELKIGDVVLCRVKGNQYLHRIIAIQGGRYQIGNNKGGINGWTKAIYGKCIRVEN